MNRSLLSLCWLGLALVAAMPGHAETLKKPELDRLAAAQSAAPSPSFRAFLAQAAKADPKLKPAIAAHEAKRPLAGDDLTQIARLLGLYNRLHTQKAVLSSIGAMVAWLVIDHELWERPGGRVARDRARLFNTATVLTVVLGVGCLYVALLVATLAAAGFLITGELLGQTLQHRVGWPEYLTIAWLASSIAPVGGALGSGLESDQSVRAAAYGYRQVERGGRDPTTG